MSEPAISADAPHTDPHAAADGPPLPRRLPGDPGGAALVERVLRVDQAGEYGAVRIYEGQLAVLGRSPAGPVIRRMAAAEREHLATFNELLAKRRVRPTALHPVWHVAGFALGAGTALLGARAAMACTAAVEEVIDTHYANQVAALGDDEAELRDTCERYRQEEADHRQTSLDHGAEGAPAYRVLSGVIKAGSRAAIWLSERI